MWDPFWVLDPKSDIVVVDDDDCRIVVVVVAWWWHTNGHCHSSDGWWKGRDIVHDPS